MKDKRHSLFSSATGTLILSVSIPSVVYSHGGPDFTTAFTGINYILSGVIPVLILFAAIKIAGEVLMTRKRVFSG